MCALVYVYVACIGTTSGVFIQRDNGVILAQDITSSEKYCTTSDNKNKKYMGLVTAIMLALKHLEKLQVARLIQQIDTVRVFIPSKVVYGWFKQKSPEAYVREYELMYNRFVNLLPEIEFVCSVDGQSVNKALAVCKYSKKEEKYTPAIDMLC